MFPNSPLTLGQSALLGLTFGVVSVISWIVVFSAEHDLLKISAIVICGITFIYSQLLLLRGAKLNALGFWVRREAKDESPMIKWGLFFSSAMLVGGGAMTAVFWGLGT